jgi:hypothetical protein
MLHITMGNTIFVNLYGILVITVDCSRNPYGFSTLLNGAMIFIFCSRKGDYLLFLEKPHQRFSAIVKHIDKSGLSIITMAGPVGVDVAN